MTDLSTTIAPKSDQLNADDLIPGPRTITVTRVNGNKDPDQPISVYFEGDNGKPYKPGKSMRRVLVYLWGKNGEDYVGRSMTLYRDPEVTFGKDKVGGIRISHMSHIDGEQTMPLTVTRGQRKPYVVQPLRQREATIDDARDWIRDARDSAELERVWKSRAMAPFREQLQADLDARKAALTPQQQGNEGPAQPQTGEDYVGV